MHKKSLKSNSQPPKLLLTSPTFHVSGQPASPSLPGSAGVSPVQPRAQRSSKHVQITEPGLGTDSNAGSVYLGSYRDSPHRSQESLRGFESSTPHASVTPPRTSVSHLQLQHLLKGVDVELEAYGIDELRDGFFDASFNRPVQPNREVMSRRASETLPLPLIPGKHLSILRSGQQQILLLAQTVKHVVSSRSGIKLSKSFLGFFISYILCLVPATKAWLGNYSYIIAISTIINHSGRSVGSQIDGAVMTILGTLAGLLWGILACYAATYSPNTTYGYGGVLAVFFLAFTALLGWLRCYFLRFYQAVICAGVAICYTCLADTFYDESWLRFIQYIIPWVLGQAIALLVCVVIFPAAGTRPVALSFHDSFQLISSSLVLPRHISISLNRNLASIFADLSETVRDFCLDMSFSPFNPQDIRILRNLTQGVIRAALAIKPDTVLFDILQLHSNSQLNEATSTVRFEPVFGSAAPVNHSVMKSSQLVAKALAGPTNELISILKESVERVDAVIMDISGHRKYLGPSKVVSSDIEGCLKLLHSQLTIFDLAEEALINSPEMPQTYTEHPELVELFLFINPVRQTADRLLPLLGKVLEMQRKCHSWRVNLPSYNFSKSLLRSNSQVRHDRGGLTAGIYFRSKEQLKRAIEDLQSKSYTPLQNERQDGPLSPVIMAQASPFGKYEDEKRAANSNKDSSEESITLRYRLWSLLHRLQGFESRFMVKVTVLATLLSIPSWLPQSKEWWNNSHSWWAVATLWIMMSPRVGGNLQDLGVRTLSAVFGSTWGALAYYAGRGNPYVMAVFAFLFMVPMLYRFTQSSHPRSGVIGCIAFTVVSLNEYDNEGRPSVAYIGWTGGIAFVVGVVAAIVTNWVLWPFVARHELRKSIAALILHSAIVYRSIVARYIYLRPLQKMYAKFLPERLGDEGDAPGPEDISRSEILEGRMREGFVRIRQLMELTRHEIRVRAPFDPLPYSALIEACEQLFERLVEIRQSSVYFQPYMLYGDVNNSTTLLAARRDAVAAILMNLYIIAGAIRADHPVPRYLPSAAVARRRLLDVMESLEADKANEPRKSAPRKGRRWADVYHYAYSTALTDIVEHLQQLQYYTKEIVGEAGF